MLTLPHTLNHSESAPSIAWQTNARASGWQVDCAGLQEFDSSALALLLDLRRASAIEDLTLQIHNPPAKLAQLATLYGIAELLQIAEPTSGLKRSAQ